MQGKSGAGVSVTLSFSIESIWQDEDFTRNTLAMCLLAWQLLKDLMAETGASLRSMVVGYCWHNIPMRVLFSAMNKNSNEHK
jgi:hypothetical protein